MIFSRHRRWLALLAVLTATSATAQAQTQICASLSAQLTALDRNQNQGLANQYQRERAALQSIQGQVAQQGCNVLFRVFAPPHCGPMLNQLDRLRATVAQLEAALRAGNAGGNAAQRNAIYRSMQRNGCLGQTEPQQPSRQATYRTLCVRTCDGYYFPISFSTTREHFRDDLAACQAQCPGQEVDLFVHRNPGETVEEAVDIDGAPYTQLVNAFAFQEAYNAACRCGTPLVTTPGPEVAGMGGPFTPLPEAATDRLAALAVGVPLPVPRPEPTEDPETLANRAGGLTLPYDPFTDGPAVALEIDGIRIVGPAYYAAR